MLDKFYLVVILFIVNTYSDDYNQTELSNDKAVHLLNEVIQYGLDQSQFLAEVEEKALYEEGIHLKKSDPAHFVGIFNKQKDAANELGKYAYASLEASSLLARQFMLSREQAVYGLERVEHRSTDLFRNCPINNEIPASSDSCPPASYPYRTFDGSCNNLQRPEWGAAFSPFLRFLPPVYGDALGTEFRKPVRQNTRDNRELPSPRMISTSVHRDSPDDESLQFSMMVMQWGQFLDHDITFTPQKRGFNNTLIKCCGEDGHPLPEASRHRDCRPIEIPTTDTFYSQFNKTCMEFVRSTPATKRDCSLGFRNQINQVTSFIDGSNIYGSSKEESESLRLFKSGKLKYTDLHFRKSLLPPLEHEVADEECRISTPNLYCFYAGDTRVNEQPGLTGMHTLWLREHNRIVKGLKQINPHWDDEKLYLEGRKIVGAIQQHITYNEWLPIVLGPKVLDIFELRLNPVGHYNGYNESVNPTIANAFAGAALRFGHSLIKNSLSRCNRDFREVPYFVRLHKELNNPANLHNFGSVDRIILGLVSKTIARRDEFITAEVTNHLFQNPRTSYGMDLASLNIQRGRDHGLAPYNIWREQCGLEKFTDFANLTKVISHRTVLRLSQIYDHVDDIDLFTGGLSESPVTGGLVGPTFACILGQQFLNLRKGDRFWYENRNVFNLEQLLEIRKTSLSRTICDNLDDIETLQPYAFLTVDDHSNRRRPCKGKGIPRLDLNKWREGPSVKTNDYGPEIFDDVQLAYQKKEEFYKEGNIPLNYQPNTLTPPESPQYYSIQYILNRSGEKLFDGNKIINPEIPKPISQAQYYTFFDNYNFDNSIDADSKKKSMKSHLESRIGDLLIAKGRSDSKDAFSRQFVKKLFSQLLKPDDIDSFFMPKLV